MHTGRRFAVKYHLVLAKITVLQFYGLNLAYFRKIPRKDASGLREPVKLLIDPQ